MAQSNHGAEYFLSHSQPSRRILDLNRRPPPPTFEEHGPRSGQQRHGLSSVQTQLSNGSQRQSIGGVPSQIQMSPYMQDPNLSPGDGFAHFANNDAFGTNAHDQELVLKDGSIIGRPSQPDMDSDPMTRFYTQQESPWFTRNLENVNSWTTNREPIIRNRSDYQGYREPARSNPDSQMTGQHGRDSGYATGTIPGPRSVYSDGHNTLEESGSLYESARTLRINPDLAGYHQPVQETFDRNETMQNMCQHDGCKAYGKSMNPSDYKKHMQRHDKPFKCDIPGCSRNEGFTTKNDLERHQKSLHKIAPANSTDRSFICQGKNCSKRNKIWPRLDNFKSHCTRMHKAENVEELIKKSEVDSSKAAPTRSGSSERSRGVTRNEEDANLLMGLSRPHGVVGGERGHTRAQGSAGMLDNITPETSAQHSNGLGTRTNGAAMARSLSSSQLPQAPKLNSPASPEQRRHSHNPPGSAGSSGSNNKLADALQRAPSKSPELSRPSSQNAMEELSKTLASDLNKALSSGSISTESLQTLIASRLMNISKVSNKRSAEDAGLSDDNPTRKQKVTCDKCSKTMSRQCDLKKHQKRHSRPWGCTNEGCNKSFGSKNDWKRHENSQHYQLETWRCHEKSDSSKINTCAKIFFRRDPFQAHLRKDHGITDEAHVREECKNRRIGRNWQGGFWCGFCKQIIRLNKKGLEAWDERFNHIDNVHFKKGQRIEAWYPLDKDVPKGELRHERNRGRGREALDGDSDGEDSELENLIGDEPPPPPPPPTESQAHTIEGTLSRHQYQQQQRISLQTEVGARTQSSEKRKDTWFCCNCYFGPMGVMLEDSCTQCQRRRCDACTK